MPQHDRIIYWKTPWGYIEKRDQHFDHIGQFYECVIDWD